MDTTTILTILVAGVVGGVVTPLWYIALRDVHRQLVPAGGPEIVDFRTAPTSSKVIDAARGFLVAAVLVALVQQTNSSGVANSMGLGLLLWAGFPVVLLIAPVIWGGQSWRLSALHAGDWLIKLLAMTAVIGALL